MLAPSRGSTECAMSLGDQPLHKRKLRLVLDDGRFDGGVSSCTVRCTCMLSFAPRLLPYIRMRREPREDEGRGTSIQLRSVRYSIL